jgi:hypothetical protein
MYDSTSKTTGLIQLIPDAVSIDGLKKRADYPGSLRKHFEKVKAILTTSNYLSLLDNVSCLTLLLIHLASTY